METTQQATPLTEAQRARVRAHLQELFKTPAFAGGPRRQAFLKYVVEETLAGRGPAIKETNIAVDVFERTPDFDAQNASIVRVTGREVRKRLAQAYASGLPSDVRLELPVGGYQPRILFLPEDAGIEQAEAAAAPSQVLPEPALAIPQRKGWRVLAWAAVLTAVAAAAILVLRPERPVDRLWDPFIGQNRPVLVYVASRRVLAVNDVEKWLPLRPGESIPTSEMEESDSNWVGAGGALGVAYFAEYLGQHNQPFNLKFGSDLSFSDLKSSPSILIGASRWTREFTGKLRFRLSNNNGQLKITDTQQPDHTWAIPTSHRSERQEGYSIVTRLLHSESGRPVLIVEGMDARNTMAAAEFVSREDRFSQFARSAPKGWESKNFQLVLRNTIHGNSPGTMEILDSQIW